MKNNVIIERKRCEKRFQKISFLAAIFIHFLRVPTDSIGYKDNAIFDRIIKRFSY
ncbi:hypothetical protein DNO_0010 [Dichelobacter nodosus VCS1703A]|uniref:Uncharacterized protein n=1 Tax=Dichelobacter nodosus (strain VCS1703A) TaxID=246195 RepID=A5EX04_DICNV|nr:hypothetical protein DNO_0010 [Dichelobacter nodosus VCS1703A]